MHIITRSVSADSLRLLEVFASQVSVFHALFDWDLYIYNDFKIIAWATFLFSILGLVYI